MSRFLNDNKQQFCRCLIFSSKLKFERRTLLFLGHPIYKFQHNFQNATKHGVRDIVMSRNLRMSSDYIMVTDLHILRKELRLITMEFISAMVVIYNKEYLSTILPEMYRSKM